MLLSYKSIELSDKDKADACLLAGNHRITESSFVDLFIWRKKYACSVAFSNGFMFTRVSDGSREFDLCPMGEGDFAAALDMLSADCAGAGRPMNLGYMTAGMKDAVEAAMPGRFEFAENRDAADYLYLTQRLAELSGKKLHGKRNFVNRFLAAYEGRWSFEMFTTSHISEVRAYEARWKRENRTSEGDLEAENAAINELLCHMEALGSVGGILRLDGEMIGFTIGTPVSRDTMGIQIEKAEWEIPGAYQMLAREFVLLHCGGYTYINREDDMGLEGLRKAKLSYDPEAILMKYNARDLSWEDKYEVS